MIKYFCKGLPSTLSNSMFYDYQSKERQVKFLVATYTNSYKWLIDRDRNLEVTKLILAMSIFYNRVVVQLESVMDFTHRIIKGNDCEGLILGQTELNDDDINVIYKVVQKFNLIMKKYALFPELFDYSDTSEFLSNLKVYLKRLDRLDEET